MIRLCLLLLFLVHANAALGITPAEIQAAVEHRIDGYRNLKFEYQAQSRFLPSPEQPDPHDDGVLRVSKDVLKLLDSDRADVSQPWLFWQQSIKQSDGTWLLSRFSAFDGVKTADYERAGSDVKWAAGTIRPFDTQNTCNANPFCEVLLANVNGLRSCEDPGWSLSRQLKESWELARSGTFEGAKTHILRAVSNGGKLEHEVEVTGAPDWLIVRRTISDLGQSSKAVTHQYKLNSSLRYGSAVYPGKGSILRPAKRSGRGVEFEFAVTSVEKLTNESRAGWIPEWPKGTTVGDRVKGENFQVAHNPEEAARILRAQQAQPQIAFGLSPFRAIVLVVNLAIVTVFVAWYLRRRARRKRDAVA